MGISIYCKSNRCLVYISAQREESCVKGGMACFTVSLTAEGYKVTEYGLQPLTIRRREDGSYMVEMTEE